MNNKENIKTTEQIQSNNTSKTLDVDYIKNLFSNSKSKHLNPADVANFKKITVNKQTKLALLAVDDATNIDYKNINNYYKLIELLDLCSLDTKGQVLDIILNAPEGSIASIVQYIGINYKKYGIPKVNSLIYQIAQRLAIHMHEFLNQ